MYTVIVMPPARRQMIRAVIWWRRNRPEAPRRVDEELDAIIEGLCEFPDRGVAVAGGRRRLVTPTTKLVVTYLVRQRAKIVEIQRVRRP